MSGNHEYRATVSWQRQAGVVFTDQKYSRAHQWRFDGGAVVAASASPGIVPLPYSDPAGVDPEEAFVASLSSCHMLFFVHHAAKKGFVLDRYEDEAAGVMGANAQGKQAMLKVTLRPRTSWSGAKQPTAADIEALHERSHHDCFIANSVTTDVTVEPR